LPASRLVSQLALANTSHCTVQSDEPPICTPTAELKNVEETVAAAQQQEETQEAVAPPPLAPPPVRPPPQVSVLGLNHHPNSLDARAWLEQHTIHAVLTCPLCVSCAACRPMPVSQQPLQQQQRLWRRLHWHHPRCSRRPCSRHPCRPLQCSCPLRLCGPHHQQPTSSSSSSSSLAGLWVACRHLLTWAVSGWCRGSCC
jgi:hypothetical protein